MLLSSCAYVRLAYDFTDDKVKTFKKIFSSHRLMLSHMVYTLSCSAMRTKFLLYQFFLKSYKTPLIKGTKSLFSVFC